MPVIELGLIFDPSAVKTTQPDTSPVRRAEPLIPYPVRVPERVPTAPPRVEPKTPVPAKEPVPARR